MKTREAVQMLANAPTKKRVGKQMTAHQSRYDKNSKEDAIIDAIDQKKILIEHAEWIDRLRSGKIDIPQFFGGVSPAVAVELLKMAVSGGSEKTRIAAISDLLDRAGFSKVQKHAVAAVDAGQSREALVSLLLGASKDLKAEGIEIIDDDQDKNK